MTDADIIRIAQESELWDAIGSIARVYGTINPAIIDFAQRIRSATIAECAAAARRGIDGTEYACCACGDEAAHNALAAIRALDGE